MSRKEEFMNGLKENVGYLAHTQCAEYLLAEIALSLAIIADALTERKDQEECEN